MASRIVFVFSPQGGQWPGMGQSLVESDPEFRLAIGDCDEALRPLRDQSVFDAWKVEPASTSWRRADFVQPLIFAVQIALARLWQSRGVSPDAIVGHSVGEIAAAHIAGALTLTEAALVVHHYSRLQQQTIGNTGMATIDLPRPEVERLLVDHPGLVIAGTNSGMHTLVSGDARAVGAIVERVRAQGQFAARIDVDVAAHSPYIDPVTEALRTCLDGLRPNPPSITFVSSRDGARITDRSLDGDYFARQLREPVCFAEAMRVVAAGGPAHYVEIGPHPVLADAVHTAIGSSGSHVLASLRRDESAHRTLFACMGVLGGFVPRPPRSSAVHPIGGAIEHMVAAALGVRAHELSRTESLFQLGLDSLMAAQLASQIMNELGVRPPLARLYGARAHELPALVTELLGSATTGPGTATDRASAVTTVDTNPHAPFELNEIQRAYFLGRQGVFDFGNVATHLYLELDGALDPDRLRNAWHRVLERHDALRLVFTPDARQRVLERAPAYELPVIDLRGHAPEAREAAMHEVARRMRSSAPDLFGWPHFEMCLHLVGEQTTRLHVNFDMLVADLQSIDVIFRDWRAFYESPETALPALTLTLRGYLSAEQAIRESRTATQAAEAYWRGRSLPPAPPLPEPFSGSARAPREPTCEHRMTRLARSRWEQVRRRARGEALTPSALLCAAYAEVLSYFGAPRFTLAVPCSRRFAVHPQSDDLVGNFTSTLLLEVDSGAGATFVERARAIRQQLWSDMDHRIVGGVRIITEMQQDLQAGVHFPVVFTSALEDLAPHTSWAGSLRTLASQTAQVHLDCIVHEYDGELIVCWDSATEHFPPDLIERMFEVFRGLLERLADSPESWRDADPLHPAIAAEWRRCAEFNATAQPVPRGHLHDGAVELAERLPHQTAIIAGDTTIEYAELARRSAQIGRLIHVEGVTAEAVVAILMQPGWEQVVAAHGISRSGAAYLPIDPGLPKRRIEQILVDAKVTLVLTQSGIDDRLAWPASVQRIRVDELSPEPAASSDIETTTTPDSLAYVMYTSGSTGQPKGVMIEHAGALNTCVDINARFSVGATDRVLALSALGFDLSVYDIFGLLAAGGAIVYPEPRARRDPGRWLELLIEHGVTIWNTAPAVMAMLVEFARTRPEVQLPQLRLVLLSGDWIPLDLPGKIRRLAPDAEIVSLGGATEASIWSICHRIDRVEPCWPSIPYGRPLANQRFYVLDSRMRPCPVEVTGELYIGGIGLARGYWNDPALTAAKLVLHPTTGERLYRTGDLGKWVPSGWIQFQGRADRQVKLRGHRIELGEIDAVLKQHPDIRDAHTRLVSSDSSHQGGVITAYVVAGQGEPSEHELREHIRKHLPEHMVPTRVLAIGEIPLTANGKVDASRLPLPARMPTASLSPHESVLERQIAGIWAALLELDLEQIGPHDRFFDLGGNSLLLVALHTQLREAHGVELDVIALFEHPTLRMMARLVAAPALANETSDAAERARIRARAQIARRARRPGQY